MPTVRLRGRTLLLLSATVVGLAAALTACGWPQPVGNKSVPEPAKPVDLQRYLGRWYEIARYDASFERGCEAATAEYSLREDGLIRVLNTCRQGSTAGRLRSAEGRAKIVPDFRQCEAQGLILRPTILRRLLGPRSRR